MRDSIFYSALKALAISICTIFGLLVGIFLFIVAIGAAVDSDEDPEINYSYAPEILANARGVRKVLSKAPVILNLKIDGVIGAEDLKQDKVRQLLIESREKSLKNDRVKAILLTINSPGGTVTDADGIYRAIKAYKEQYKVPVFAYVDGLCASGGMYIACSADKIYASDTSIVGSVGVIIPSFFNVSKLLDNWNIDTLTLTAGKDKDELNPVRPWRKNEGKNLQDIVDYFYLQFVNVVTTARPRLDHAKLVEEYGAKIFPAKISEELGYVDEVGTSYNQVLAELVKKIGIEDDYYQVVHMEKKNWLENIFKSDSSLATGKIQHELKLPPMLSADFNNQFLYLYRPE